MFRIQKNSWKNMYLRLKIFFFEFLIGGELLYNIVMVFAIHQHESAIGIHRCLPLKPPPPPPPSPSYPSRFAQRTGFAFPVLYSRLPLAIYFTYGNVYVSMLLSQIFPPSLSSTVTKCLLSVSACPLLPCR